MAVCDNIPYFRCHMYGDEYGGCQLCGSTGPLDWGYNQGDCDTSYSDEQSGCWCQSSSQQCSTAGSGLGPHSGDVNQDGTLDVNDVMKMVGHVLETTQLNAFEITLADMPTGINNQPSGHVDVMDVIKAVEVIVAGGGMSRQQSNQIKQQVTQQSRTGRGRMRTTNYNRGGTTNRRSGRINSKWRGRTQTNPKGRPKK